MKRKTTPIQINKELHNKFKIKVIKDNRIMKYVIETLLVKYLNGEIKI